MINPKIWLYSGAAAGTLVISGLVYNAFQKPKVRVVTQTIVDTKAEEHLKELQTKLTTLSQKYEGLAQQNIELNKHRQNDVTTKTTEIRYLTPPANPPQTIQIINPGPLLASTKSIAPSPGSPPIIPEVSKIISVTTTETVDKSTSGSEKKVDTKVEVKATTDATAKVDTTIAKDTKTETHIDMKKTEEPVKVSNNSGSDRPFGLGYDSANRIIATYDFKSLDLGPSIFNLGGLGVGIFGDLELGNSKTLSGFGIGPQVNYHKSRLGIGGGYDVLHKRAIGFVTLRF